MKKVMMREFYFVCVCSEREREVSGLAGLGKRAAGLQFVCGDLFVTCERDDRVRDPRDVREVAVYIYTVFDLMLLFVGLSLNGVVASTSRTT